MKLFHGAVIGLILICLGGCSFKTECEIAVDHIITVISNDSDVPKDKRIAMRALRNRKIILEQCYEDYRPEVGIACVLKATTLKQINACHGSMRKK